MVEHFYTSQCKSLSERSTLTYHLGANPQGELHIRLLNNSGSGYFNKEWVAWSEIDAMLKVKGYIKRADLQRLYEGKSNNSSGFLAAALLHVGLLKVQGEGYIGNPSFEKPKSNRGDADRKLPKPTNKTGAKTT
jgi:hypothetical protein